MPQEDPPIAALISLAGKRAIITGGATGLGLAIARRLAEAGASMLLADVDTAGGREAARALQQAGYHAGFASCDVSREPDVRAMVQQAVEQLGGIDILVNNAGVYPRTPLTETSLDEFNRVLAVNLTGTFLCSREVAARMIEQDRGGCIINLASIDAVHPSYEGMAAYDSSKGGVLMLTRSLARELGKHNIRVNAIAPGGIMTRALVSSTGSTSEEEARRQRRDLKSFMARMVLGRMGEPDEIARVALFLASEMASYITGTMVVADGGYLVS